MAVLCLNFPCIAQSKAPITPLKIGDQFPDITISNMLNYKAGNLSTASLKGKVIILDFWATWCSACLINFPRIEALEQKFGDRVFALGVAYEPVPKIRQFFTSANGKRYHIKTAVADTLLSRLFPHTGLPHYVMIDGAGKVVAITGAEEVNEANIQKALSGQNVQVQTKKDLDATRPLFLDEAYPPGNEIVKYSILSKGHYSGLGTGNHPRTKGGKNIGIAVTNSNLLWLYETAAIKLFNKQQQQFSEKRMILDVQDPAKITLNLSKARDGSYDQDNLYNYDLILPQEQADRLYETMLSELNALTAYTGVVEKQEVPCYVLQRTDSTDRLRSKGGISKNTLFRSAPYQISNRPLKQLVIRLGDLESIDRPVVDETGYTGMVDLTLTGSTDIREIRNALRPYGLDLREAKRSLLMLIVTDKKSSTHDLKP